MADMTTSGEFGQKVTQKLGVKGGGEGAAGIEQRSGEKIESIH